MNLWSYLLRGTAAVGLSVAFVGVSYAQISALSHTNDATPSNSRAQQQHILVVGDSLSAAYGIDRELGWVSLLQKRLQSLNPEFKVTNASISGDTTSGGINRLPALLQTHQPSLVIVELGANDALRGLPLQMSQQNLAQMLSDIKEAQAQPLLVGMQIPPNYGPAYTQAFEAMFADLATQTNTPLVPFLLKGIETDRDQFIEDGIHPNAQAQPQLLENVWKILEPLVADELNQTP